MPKIYRVMAEKDGRPRPGDSSNELGVRPKIDITVDEARNVAPASKGMSVNVCGCQTHPNVIPGRLQHIRRGAVGEDDLRLWRAGEGPFAAVPFASRLELRPDGSSEPAAHGVIQPNAVMPLSEYQAALAATRDEWSVDENRNPNCPHCGGKPPRPDCTPPFFEYVHLLLRLQTAMSRKDEALANQLREEMEAPADQLSPFEMDWLSELPGDLYLLEGKEFREANTQTPDDCRRAVLNAWVDAEDAPEDLLALLRKEQDFLPEDMVAIGRARAYGALGFPRLFWEFAQYAARRAPENGPDDPLVSEPL